MCSVCAGETICTIVTDKATNDFECLDEGYIAKILVPDGAEDLVVGVPIAILVEEKVISLPHPSIYLPIFPLALPIRTQWPTSKTSRRPMLPKTQLMQSRPKLQLHQVNCCLTVH